MNSKPKYLVRPDDYMVFSLNEDGETYSTHKSKIEWPNNLHHKYTAARLWAANFFPCEEDELGYFVKKQDEYYRLLNNKLDEENRGCGD